MKLRIYVTGTACLFGKHHFEESRTTIRMINISFTISFALEAEINLQI